MRKGGVDILLHRHHLHRLPAIVGGKLAPNLVCAIWRGEVAMYAVLIVLRERILVRRNDPALRWIEESGQVVERNKTLPFIIARASVHRNIAVVRFPDRQQAARVITDISVHVGIDKILPGTWKTPD